MSNNEPYVALPEIDESFDDKPSIIDDKSSDNEPSIVDSEPNTENFSPYTEEEEEKLQEKYEVGKFRPSIVLGRGERYAFNTFIAVLCVYVFLLLIYFIYVGFTDNNFLSNKTIGWMSIAGVVCLLIIGYFAVER